MKAARLIDGVVTVVDAPTPEPGIDQVLVHITAAGVCHSDLHLGRGVTGQGWASTGSDRSATRPSEWWRRSDPGPSAGWRSVTASSSASAAPAAASGAGRASTASPVSPATAASRWGSWACSPSSSSSTPPGWSSSPTTLSDLEAPLACGGLTAYGAVRKLFAHGVQPGSTVAVVGAAGGWATTRCSCSTPSGTGSSASTSARNGSSSSATSAPSWPSAPTTRRPRWPRPFGGVHASLVFSARIAGYQLGLQLLRKGGVFVAVGLPASSDGNMQLNPFDLLMRDPTIVFSAVGTVQEMRELVDLAARGVVRTHVSRTGPISELDDDLRRARRGPLPRPGRHHRPEHLGHEPTASRPRARRTTARRSADSRFDTAAVVTRAEPWKVPGKLCSSTETPASSRRSA